MRLLIILSIILSSCTSSLYTANTRNAPLFRDQGEAQISGYVSSGGFEAQGAYAFTDHIAAIGSYAYGSSKQSSPTDYTHKNSNAEIGIGLFDRTRSFRYEAFVGYGFGEVTDAGQYYFFGLNNTVIATAKMTRLFLQPSIGTNNKDFNLIFTPRLEWVNFSEFTTATASAKPTDKAPIFLEPALTSKLRISGNIHAIFQLGVVFPFSSDVFYEYSKLQATLGVQIDTGGLRTKVY
ncbi:MAG TPA: hypothetical protein PLR06_02880 [Cyclobacteriaceae bacterium]|nr:hypothetical protein [Cyclobacteriaceae bacterium]